ncbi:hypothetical protein ABID56_001782 [Alkalibacillus flavidus]|uniref:Cytosolic protein n=1 Tax=Alkalibacillus flavidus TaxID=546021 RepID=A0ABV2KVR2_9BACI
MAKKKKNDDFATVEVQQNMQVPEEFPEGTYGEPVHDEPLQAREYDPKRRHYSAFNYENKQLHHDIPRQYPSAHQPNNFPDDEDPEHPDKG